MKPGRREPEGMAMIRLYRFFNFERDAYGEPFALCDVCLKSQPVPEQCYLNKIADRALLPCAKCGSET
jgi:hypothetical protein